MAVDASVDRLLEALEGNSNLQAAFGNVEADNELAAHVLELKCREPAVDLAAQARDFSATIRQVNQVLAGWNARLMPTGMHPFMDPAKESALWPHADSPIYQSYNRIFGCRGHGWFNIQSVHLNLPFANDREFSRLHNAISLLLPLLPALAAASPVFGGAHNGWLDGRLFHYVGNQRRLPAIIGDIIPEPIGSEAEYREVIFAPMYKAIRPLDPDGILAHEWLNSRAAIARFDRSAIEIRCLDTQERSLADVALCHWVVSVLTLMLDSDSDFLAIHRKVPTGLLKSLFLDSARYGMAAKVPEGFPSGAFGLGVPFTAVTVRDLLLVLTDKAFAHAARPLYLKAADEVFAPARNLIFSEGNLAERILKAAPNAEGYRAVYAKLCDCLEKNLPFKTRI